MNNKKKLTIPIIGIAVVIIAAFLAYGFYQNSDTTQINRQLELAQHYLLKGDYEQAIVAYEAVIEIDPRNTNAYLGLAEAYTGKGDLEEAVKVLEEGYAMTEAEELQVQIEVWSEELAQREAQKEAEKAEALLAKEKETTDTKLESETVKLEEKESKLSTESTEEEGEPQAESSKAEEEGKAQTELLKKETSSEEANQQPVTMGFVERGGNLYYYDEQGNLVIGWFEVDEKRYQADLDGKLCRNGEYEIDGVMYQFDEDGLCLGEVQTANQQSVASEEPEAVSQPGIIVEEEYQDIEYYVDGSYAIFSYDGQGNVIKAEWYNADGSLEERDVMYVDYYVVYYYDGQGNLTSDERYKYNVDVTEY